MPTAVGHQAYRQVVEKAADAARTVAGVTDVTVRVRRARLTGTVDEPAIEDGAQATEATEATEATAPDVPGGLPEAQVDGAPLVLPGDAPATLTEALRRAAREVPGRGTTYVLGDGGEVRQTYSGLLDDAACIASGLRDAGLRPGDSVLLHCDDNLNFVTGFWACLLGGFVATPIAMAPAYDWENATTRRIRDAWDLLEHPPILTDAAFQSRVGRLRKLWSEPDLAVLAVEDLRASPPGTAPYPARPDDPAVHLLTSGSTGVPKCVRHSHRTVVTRAYANAKANGFGADDVTLNFMPLDHVAGMVMHNLRDVVLQCEHVNARTDSFLGDPLRWLDWIERYRVTNTSAPNFAVTLVTTHAERIARGTWDLSTLRDITNGGEAIVSRTMHEFLRMLEPHGLAPDVMRPAWGMSEMCGGMVHSTLRRDDESAGVVTVDARTMNGTLRTLPGPAPGHPTFTEVGVPIDGTSVRVVDDGDRVVTERRIGRLQVRGVTHMTGYHNNPEANARAYTADGWFDTGDLAFVHDGRLVMTGREKELIVVRSANYPCHEIESVVERVDGVLPTFVAAASEHDAVTGTQELVVFCAPAVEGTEERRSVIRAVRTALAREVGLQPRRVVPVPPEAFPKTSAGKVERGRLLAEYEAGAFDAALEALGLGTRADDEVPEAGDTWLFHDVWAHSPGIPGTPPGGVWLVLGHGELAARLQAGRDPGLVVSVSPGRSFQRVSDTAYRVDPASPSDHAALREAVERDHGRVGALVHSWATRTYADRTEAVDRGIEAAAISVLGLVQAFAGSAPRLLVVTTAAFGIDDDDPVEPVHATVGGLVRTANAERGSRWARQLDVSPGEADLAALVRAELADTTDDELVAYRNERRLTSRIRPVEGASEQDAVHRIRPGGLYLITGGLGGIGFLLARHLLTAHSVRLVLNGRGPATGERARRLAELSRLGDVTYHQADVADAEALRSIVTEAEGRCGRALDGVLHLAGADISGYWADLESHLLVRESPDEFRSLYRPKVLGTYALAALLSDRPGTALVLFSSVNGHFGGTAFGAYASASGFLPAFARYWRRLGRTVQCQSWSLWATDGTDGAAAAVDRHGFRLVTPDDGVRLFTEALSRPEVNLLIGLDDGNEHIAREADAEYLDGLEVIVTLGATTSVSRQRVAEAVRATLPTTKARVRVTTGPPGRHDATAEADGALTSDLEDRTARIWREVLGASAADREAHFFELGGNSMTAIRLVDRLNSALGTELVVQQLYEHPTLRELAAEIRRTSPEPTTEPADPA